MKIHGAIDGYLFYFLCLIRESLLIVSTIRGGLIAHKRCLVIIHQNTATFGTTIVIRSLHIILNYI